MDRSCARPYVCPIFFPTLIGRAAQTQRDSPRAARDAASVHFRPSIARTDIIYLTVGGVTLYTLISRCLHSNRNTEMRLSVTYTCRHCLQSGN